MKRYKDIGIKLLFLLLVIVLYQLSNMDFFKEITSSSEFREEEVMSTVLVSEKENFQIYFMDVGQADSILIANNGEYALIDAGNNEDGKKLVEYFHSLGITSFRYVIATHAHEDHIGGMDDIIRSFSIEHFLMPDVVATTKTFEEVLDALSDKQILFETPDIDATFTMAETKFTVLWIGDDREDLNNDSIVLKVTYKNTSYLLMADATSTIEKEILDKNLESDLLKVGHHGSKYSTTAAFLRKVNPSIAVISVGKNNDYGFPKDVVLEKLEKIHTKIYRTDELGTIIASSDGNEIYIESVRTDTNG